MTERSKTTRIGFIGSGNVATHLALAINAIGLQVEQIYSRSIANAEILANKVKAQAINSVSDFSENLDLVIISINDSSFLELDLSSINDSILICHTSGALEMNTLAKHENYGVFYPLQTFSKTSLPNISEVPFCLEANTNDNLEKLKNLAILLSNNINEIDSEQRKALHLAAVFVCNFTNAMYNIGDEIIAKSDLSFDLLRPLIEETANKIKTLKPIDAQTGPAIRNNTEIMNEHINLLKESPDYINIYKEISKIIFKKTK